MTQADTNGLVTELTTEQKLDALIYLHAELSVRFTMMAQAMAALLAQQMQPQMQSAIFTQLTGASPPTVT